MMIRFECIEQEIECLVYIMVINFENGMIDLTEG